MPKIEVRRLSKTFSDGEITAIGQLDLSIDDGEIYCLLGPSGCGKSTALHLIAGFDRPSEGEILVDGEPVRGPGPDRAVVFQKPLLFPWFTVLQNISFGPILAKVDRAAARRQAMSYIEAIGLAGFEHRYPYELSGGMQQRVSLARAWVNKPGILLLDEPFGALDAQTKLVMQELLLEMCERFRTTILFITHDVDEAIFLGDKIGVMSRRPGTLRSEIAVPLPRPRGIEVTVSDEFVRVKKQIMDYLREMIVIG